MRYNGDPTSFFSPENVGIVGYDSTRNTYQFGNYLQESLGGFGGDYSGNQRINAAYLMLDFKPVGWLRLVAGSRFEATRMVVTNTSKRGTLNDDDWLPSVNTTVLLRPDMNLRLAYGKTLARPNFREKAPYTSFEFAQDVLFSGNPELKRTLIDNYDVRWEWFPQPGEVVSVSGFYKRFKNPIERTINVGFASEGALVDYENVDHATVYGTELEIRKALSFLSGSLQYFSLASNLSLIKSEVNIPEAELRSLRALDPNASDTRELQGQSPYLVNVSLNYDHPLRGTVASLHYNVFGDRLFEVALGGTPGVYERARHLLNFTFSQKIFRVLKVKFAVKNILDSDNRYTHQYNNHEYIRQLYKSGRNFSFGLQYSIN
ncbi:MAG: TonB-dependent receptor [Chloroflexi bacterium]|nr:MAG: TonB-dependent receptor [Chloroflexota bacterium]